jgi:hypothetical protein
LTDVRSAPSQPRKFSTHPFLSEKETLCITLSAIHTKSISNGRPFFLATHSNFTKRKCGFLRFPFTPSKVARALLPDVHSQTWMRAPSQHLVVHVDRHLCQLAYSRFFCLSILGLKSWHELANELFNRLQFRLILIWSLSASNAGTISYALIDVSVPGPRSAALFLRLTCCLSLNPFSTVLLKKFLCRYHFLSPTSNT